MSIGTGTLQPNTRVIRPIWLAALLAIVLAFAGAVIVTNAGQEAARDTTPARTEVSGTAANTPSELRGGVESAVGGTLANTPIEVRPHVPRRAANAESFSGTVGNTPSELSGGLPAPAEPHEAIVVNGTQCGQCR